MFLPKEETVSLVIPSSSSSRGAKRVPGFPFARSVVISSGSRTDHIPFILLTGYRPEEHGHYERHA